MRCGGLAHGTGGLGFGSSAKDTCACRTGTNRTGFIALPIVHALLCPALLSAVSRAFPRLEELEVARGPAEHTREAALEYTQSSLPVSNPLASPTGRTKPAESGEPECQQEQQQQQQQQSGQQPRPLTGPLPFSEHRQGGSMANSAFSDVATHASGPRDDDHWLSDAWAPAAPQPPQTFESLLRQWRPPPSLEFGSLLWPALRVLRLYSMSTSAPMLPATALPNLEELYLEDGVGNPMRDAPLA